MAFELVCEIEPPTKPDLSRIRTQIEVMGPVADAFLAPDNHIGRATVSSIAVAHEIQRAGARGIACLNSRDRNLLGFRRDLLTAAAYGVERFLFVYGDKPTHGNRMSDLTVRGMLEHTRTLADQAAFDSSRPFQVGVTSGLRRLPAWKQDADFVFAQVGFDLDALLAWRDANPVECPVYAGVLVLASADMARGIAASIPDIAIPADLVDKVTLDKAYGVEAACSQVERIRETGAFDGVHLVTGVRFRAVAERLAR